MLFDVIDLDCSPLLSQRFPHLARTHFQIAGLPGVVTAKCAIRGAASDVNSVHLISGQVITREKLPRFGPGTQLFDPVVRLQHTLAGLNLTAEEADFYALLCFFSGDSRRVEALRPPTLAVGSDRLVSVNGAVAQTMSVAIDITRMHRFQESFVVLLGILADLE